MDIHLPTPGSNHLIFQGGGGGVEAVNFMSVYCLMIAGLGDYFWVSANFWDVCHSVHWIVQGCLHRNASLFTLPSCITYQQIHPIISSTWKHRNAIVFRVPELYSGINNLWKQWMIYIGMDDSHIFSIIFSYFEVWIIPYQNIQINDNKLGSLLALNILTWGAPYP